MKKWKTFDDSIGYEGEILEKLLDKIILKTAAEIQAGGKWKATPEVRAAEEEIEQIHAEVMAGSKSIDDYRAVCLRWKEAGTR